MDINEYIKSIRNVDANRRSRVINYCRNADSAKLARLYNNISLMAPHRHKHSKRYLFERDGSPSTAGLSNREEEHLAISLFNKCKAFDRFHLAHSSSIQILDYQVPLKAKQSDAGVGKIDLLGLRDAGGLCVMELKVKGGDTPIAATLEALVYSAILDANRSDITTELNDKGIACQLDGRPDIFVFAPVDYWNDYAKKLGSSWLNNIKPFLISLSKALGLHIDFYSIDFSEFIMGNPNNPPHIGDDLTFNPLLTTRSEIPK